MSAAFSVLRKAFVNWYDSMLTLVVLNMLWLLSLVTIVLLPPATAALYAVTNEMMHTGSGGFSEFFEAGRRYFIKSWIWALMNLLMLAVIWANIVFYGQQKTDLAAIVQALFVMLGVYWLVIQFYFWPFLMEQTDKRVFLALRNSVLTALASPGFTLLMALAVILMVVLSVVFVLPAGVMTATVIALMGNHAVLNRLETFGKLQPPDAEAETESAKDKE